LSGKLVARVGGLDHQHVERRRRLDAPHRAAGQHHVVTRLQRQSPEIAVQLAGAAVDEQQLVAVGVAREARHAPGNRQ